MEHGALVEWYWRWEKESTWSKTFRMPVCPTLIPHGLAWDETQVYVLRSSWLKEWMLRSQKNKHWKCNFENIWQYENISWLHVCTVAFQEQWLWNVYHENYKSGFIFQLCNCMLLSNMNVTSFSFSFTPGLVLLNLEAPFDQSFAQRFYKLHNQCQPESQVLFLLSRWFM